MQERLITEGLPCCSDWPFVHLQFDACVSCSGFAKHFLLKRSRVSQNVTGTENPLVSYYTLGPRSRSRRAYPRLCKIQKKNSDSRSIQWEAATAGWHYCQRVSWHSGTQADVHRTLKAMAPCQQGQLLPSLEAGIYNKAEQYVTFPMVPTQLFPEISTAIDLLSACHWERCALFHLTLTISFLGRDFYYCHCMKTESES